MVFISKMNKLTPVIGLQSYKIVVVVVNKGPFINNDRFLGYCQGSRGSETHCDITD